jgi:8-oxo-dGTP diphosphatase
VDELKKSVVTGILVKNDRGELLLVKKPENVGPYAGTYLTPGGGINTGEPADKAALRELYEETGVKVDNLKRAFFDDDVAANWEGIPRHYIMLMYTADYVSGDLKPTEGDDDNLEVIKWFSLDDIKQMPLSPPLRNLLNHLGYLKD